MSLNRREVLILGAGALAGIARLAPAAHAEGAERHGISAFGDLKYPADFAHFDYVDPNAPKGGVFSQIGPTRLYNQNFQTFNSFNSFILKGDAAQGMELTFATLIRARPTSRTPPCWPRAPCRSPTTPSPTAIIWPGRASTTAAR